MLWSYIALGIIPKDIKREITSYRSKKMQCMIKNAYEKALYFYINAQVH